MIWLSQSVYREKLIDSRAIGPKSPIVVYLTKTTVNDNQRLSTKHLHTHMFWSCMQMAIYARLLEKSIPLKSSPPIRVSAGPNAALLWRSHRLCCDRLVSILPSRSFSLIRYLCAFIKHYNDIYWQILKYYSTKRDTKVNVARFVTCLCEIYLNTICENQNQSQVIWPYFDFIMANCTWVFLTLYFLLFLTISKLFQKLVNRALTEPCEDRTC